MSEKNNKTEEVDINTQIYELGFLFVPNVKEDEIPVLFNNLRDLILSYKAEIIGEEMPKIIDLAYTLSKTIKNNKNKYDNAYFGWIKFEIDTSSVIELKNKLDLDPNIIRFLLIKTVRENTIAPKRLVSKENGGRKRVINIKKDGDEIAVKMDEVEVDKEIDAMLAS